MSESNGHNGSGQRPDNVTSLDAARRRAEMKRRQDAVADPAGRVSTRDWIIGGIVILMALAMIATWISGLIGGGTPARHAPTKTSQLMMEAA